MSMQARLAGLSVLLFLHRRRYPCRNRRSRRRRRGRSPSAALTLKYCNSDFDGSCGQLKRPLDPTGGIKGTITIGFEYYPRFDQGTPARGTLLPQEGGPGWSSELGTRDAYLNVFGALREHRDVLMIDKRGTGTSGAINCREIQTGDPSDPARAGGVRRSARRRRLISTARTSPSTTSPRYSMCCRSTRSISTATATAPSSGRRSRRWHPEHLRSLILDSAYPVRPSDIWFPTDWTTGRDGLDLVCDRSPVVSRAARPRGESRIERLLRELASQADQRHRAGFGWHSARRNGRCPELFLLITNLGNSPITYRDLDAAARAWFDNHDKLPLLRLAAEYNTPFVTDAVDLGLRPVPGRDLQGISAALRPG